MSRDAEFKTRFFAVLEDLKREGSNDAPAMWLLGSLASDLASELKQPSWTAAKSAIDRATFDALLRAFRDQGNEHHREGRDRHAYAIQVLTVSLIASNQQGDAELAEGVSLMDVLIDAAVTAYRQNPSSAPRAN